MNDVTSLSLSLPLFLYSALATRVLSFVRELLDFLLCLSAAYSGVFAGAGVLVRTADWRFFVSAVWSTLFDAFGFSLVQLKFHWSDQHLSHGQ